MANTIMHYDPFVNLMNHLFERGDIKRSLNSDQSVVEGSSWVPRVDIKEEPNRFILFADIPGVDPEKIEIFMENGVLTIRGERVSESQKEGVDFSRIERITGSFERRFTLPDTADPDNITAHGTHGVLEVVIPKREKAKAKKISVVPKQ